MRLAANPVKFSSCGAPRTHAVHALDPFASSHFVSCFECKRVWRVGVRAARMGQTHAWLRQGRRHRWASVGFVIRERFCEDSYGRRDRKHTEGGRERMTAAPCIPFRERLSQVPLSWIVRTEQNSPGRTHKTAKECACKRSLSIDRFETTHSERVVSLFSWLF